MPYITFSRNMKVPRRALLDTCRKIAALFEQSVVVMRGSKSVEGLAVDAASKGFGSILMLQGSAPQKLEVIKVKNLGRSYAWGNEYVLKAAKSKLVIERGGRNAQKALIKEADD
jgi:rRNA maturation protein Rpf1